MDKEGEGKEEGAGEVGKDVLELKSQLVELTKKLGEVTTANSQLLNKVAENEALYTSPEYMDYQEAREQARTSKESGNEMDLDRATGSELVTHLEGILGKALEKMGEGVSNNIAKISDSVQMLGNRMDVKLVEVQDPTFAEFKETDEGLAELRMLAKELPTYSMKQLWDTRNERVANSVAREERESAELKEKERAAAAEKPGMAFQLAKGEELSDEEIASRAYDIHMKDALFEEDEGM